MAWQTLIPLEDPSVDAKLRERQLPLGAGRHSTSPKREAPALAGLGNTEIALANRSTLPHARGEALESVPSADAPPDAPSPDAGGERGGGGRGVVDSSAGAGGVVQAGP